MPDSPISPASHEAADATIPVVPNPSRAPVSELTTSAELFAQKRLLLGDAHQFEDGLVAPCGAACPYRMKSISCPFWKTPCLVGCTVKQVLLGEGYSYTESEFFVIAQVGPYLIGEEVILNMHNPRAAHLRVVRNKRGELAQADSGLDGSLFDHDTAYEFTEEDLARVTGEQPIPTERVDPTTGPATGPTAGPAGSEGAAS